jgi:hypothetical protein
MTKIIEASQLPEKEKVYLKKDMFGWRTVEPIKDPETNKINLYNLITGGKRNLVWLIFVFVALAVLYYGITELIDNYKTIADNPCDYCEDCYAQTRQVINDISQEQYASWEVPEVMDELTNP